MTLGGLCEVMLVSAARDGQFEQCWISRRVIWPCVIAVLYWAVCLSCQTYCSFLAAAARSFTPSINLQAPCLYDLLLGHCIDFFYQPPPSVILQKKDKKKTNDKRYKGVIKSWLRDNILVSLLSGMNHMISFIVFLYLICRGWRDKGTTLLKQHLEVEVCGETKTLYSRNYNNKWLSSYNIYK